MEDERACAKSTRRRGEAPLLLREPATGDILMQPPDPSMAELDIAVRRPIRMLRLLPFAIGGVVGATLIPSRYWVSGLGAVAAITAVLSSVMQSLVGDEPRTSMNLLYGVMALVGASFGMLLRMVMHALAS
jgi:hypothetical protein